MFQKFLNFQERLRTDLQAQQSWKIRFYLKYWLRINNILLNKVIDNVFAGMVAFDKKDFPVAKKYFDIVESKIGKYPCSSDTPLEILICLAETKVCLGKIYYNNNEKDQAFSYLLQAEKIYDLINDQEITELYGNKFMSYYYMHKIDMYSGLINFDRSYEIKGVKCCEEILRRFYLKNSSWQDDMTWFNLKKFLH